MTESWDPTVLIVTVVPAFAAIILALGYLARRVIDGAGPRDVPFRGAVLISSEAAHEITDTLRDLVAAQERGILAHERQATATEQLLAAQKDQIRRTAEARRDSEIDDLKRQVADLTRELARDRPVPAKRT